MGVPVCGADVHRAHVRHGLDLRPRHRLLPRRARGLHPLEEPRGQLGQLHAGAGLRQRRQAGSGPHGDAGPRQELQAKGDTFFWMKYKTYTKSLIW